MKYKCITFRGFYFSEDEDGAFSMAKKMLEDIQKGNFGKELWWVIIVDLSTNRERLLTSFDEGIINSTQWLQI